MATCGTTSGNGIVLGGCDEGGTIVLVLVVVAFLVLIITLVALASRKSGAKAATRDLAGAAAIEPSLAPPTPPTSSPPARQHWLYGQLPDASATPAASPRPTPTPSVKVCASCGQVIPESRPTATAMMPAQRQPGRKWNELSEGEQKQRIAGWSVTGGGAVLTLIGMIAQEPISGVFGGVALVYGLVWLMVIQYHEAVESVPKK
jgi:hypothetical protein